MNLSRIAGWLWGWAAPAGSGARLGRRIRLTRPGWGYLLVLLAAFTGAVVRDSNLMLLLAGLLLGPLLGSFWFALVGLRRLELVREAPASLCAGEKLVVDLRLHNPRRRLASWALVAEDPVRYLGPLGVFPTAAPRVLFPCVSPAQTSHATYEGQPPVRGRYRLGPLRLSSSFPLGLVRFERTFGARATIVVWPRLGRLTPDGLQLARPNLAGRQQTQRRQARREANFYGLRDWRPGDSRRWIHWRSTARRGQLVVRQFDETGSSELALLLDLWQPAGGDPAAAELVERAVSLAASILVESCRRGGRRLSLHVAGSETVRRQGWASQVLLREMLDELAVVRSHPRDGLTPEFLEDLAGLQPAQTALVISTREFDPQRLQPPRPDAQAVSLRSIRVLQVADPNLSRYFLHEAAN